jgi:hypothetical protein
LLGLPQAKIQIVLDLAQTRVHIHGVLPPLSVVGFEALVELLHPALEFCYTLADCGNLCTDSIDLCADLISERLAELADPLMDLPDPGIDEYVCATQGAEENGDNDRQHLHPRGHGRAIN